MLELASLARAKSLCGRLNDNLLVHILTVTVRRLLAFASRIAAAAALQDLVDLDHELPTVFDFFKSLDTLSIHLVEVVKLVLKAVSFGTLEDLRRDVVAEAIEHNFFEKLALFGAALHEDEAHLLKLLLRHRLDSLLDHA
eukprot:CAMPEP_0185574564 /NCGR_PEP_ID=MMETSP0434-20130131/6005_1 /TAXON_ID=626734 ORGANISM="Favella taraikaensis, Strain Fe Narragansett Bay" /NCGR_SAMPLE_ID=MMETSP0434 /ASSEMBLY_ACC=CAM_ASM_000379 /LENGTH=139 /DNA_ID=CAMNT_0028191185 /DNA_START=483 /DNA_END=902 /DNA_ORIENTATION=-